jgi:membrane-associated phospholipid phosphatase
LLEYLRSLIPWGLEVILWVQRASSPALDVAFRLLTTLGRGQLYIGVFLGIYWCLHKTLAQSLAYIFVFSEYANSVIKDWFNLPRPYDVDPRIHAPLPEQTPSFPSGHAQSAFVFCYYLAGKVRRRWAWLLATALILAISFSRVYLGVHFPQDILGGWAIGFLLLVLYAWARHWKFPRKVRFSLAIKLVLSVTVPVALLLMHPTVDTAKLMGLGVGLAAGFELEQQYVRFGVSGAWWKRAVRYVAGIVPLLGLYAGLGRVLPSGLPFVAFSHAVTGIWGSYGAPWLFVATGLAGREPRPS